MVEHGSLASLVITSNLIDEIKKAQHEDKGMMKLRARISEEKLKCFKLDDQGIFGLGNDWWFPRIFSLERKFLMRLMNLNFLSIPVATRCIKI